MSHLRVALLVLLSFSCSLLGHCVEINGQQLEKAYNSLNEYLTKLLTSDDVETNLALAEKFPTPGVDEQGAKKLFLSLGGIKPENKCSRDSYLVLLKNDQATGGHARQLPFTHARRIDKLVNRFCLEHAKKCQSSYMDKLRSKYPSLKKEEVKRVETLMDQVLTNHYFLKTHIDNQAMVAKLFNQIIMAPDPVKGTNSARSLYITLSDLTMDNPESGKYLRPTVEQGKRTVQDDKIRGLLDRYVIEPCEYYVKELGSEIFEPARFDANWSHEIKEEAPEFYEAWARFRFCQSLINYNRNSLIEGIVKISKLSR